jgi:N-acetylneuraminic acid mutarotase
MAAAAHGKLYVIGGEISTSGIANQGIYIANVYEYDPATATWTEKSPMPTARSAGATGVIDGKIYVAGGRPPRGSDFAVYDPLADRWTVLPDLPTQRNHLAAGAIGGRLYVVGGRFGGGVGSEMTGVVEVYDPATNTWTSAAPLPTARGGVNGIAARGCFYAFGGEGNDADPRGVFAENEVYDPRTDTWQSLEPIPTPVHGVTGAAYLDGWIHLPGGGVARGGNSGSTIHQVFRAVIGCE